VGLSDVGAFLTQLPFKENAVQERIVRAVSVPAGTGAAAGAWDSCRRIETIHSQTLTAAMRGTLEMLSLCRRIEIRKLENPVPSGTAEAPWAWNIRVTG
jgi:hypothetical protein